MQLLECNGPHLSSLSLSGRDRCPTGTKARLGFPVQPSGRELLRQVPSRLPIAMAVRTEIFQTRLHFRPGAPHLSLAEESGPAQAWPPRTPETETVKTYIVGNGPGFRGFLPGRKKARQAPSSRPEKTRRFAGTKGSAPSSARGGMPILNASSTQGSNTFKPEQPRLAL